MEWFSILMRHLGEPFRFLFIVDPWEQAIRVRAGKHIKKFQGGIHFRLPFFDKIYKQNTRKRVISIDAQTVTTTDKQSVTIAGALEYRITDVLPLYLLLHNANDTIANTAQAVVSQYISTHELSQCEPDIIMKHVTEEINLKQWGLEGGKFLLTDFAVVKTYRFITGQINKYVNDYINMGADGERI